MRLRAFKAPPLSFKYVVPLATSAVSRRGAAADRDAAPSAGTTALGSAGPGQAAHGGDVKLRCRYKKSSRRCPPGRQGGVGGCMLEWLLPYPG